MKKQILKKEYVFEYDSSYTSYDIFIPCSDYYQI